MQEPFNEAGYEPVFVVVGLLILSLSLCIIFSWIYIATHTSRVLDTSQKLMICKTICDFSYAFLIYLMLMLDNEYLATHRSVCSFLGAFTWLFFVLSNAYLAGMCWHLRQTLLNPFHQTMTRKFHFAVWIVSLLCVCVPWMMDAFAYREKVFFCSICDTGHYYNPYNMILVDLPLWLSNLLAIYVTLHAWVRLKQTLSEAFELKLDVIRRQVSLVAICILQAVFWLVVVWIPQSSTKNEHHNWNLCIETSSDDANNSPTGSYEASLGILLLVSMLIPCLGDGIACFWAVRRSLRMIRAKKIDDNDDMTQKKQQNLSTALRREIIEYMTRGIVESVKLVANETYKRRLSISVTSVEPKDPGVVTPRDDDIVNFSNVLDCKEPRPADDSYPKKLRGEEEMILHYKDEDNMQSDRGRYRRFEIVARKLFGDVEIKKRASAIKSAFDVELLSSTDPDALEETTGGYSDLSDASGYENNWPFVSFAAHEFRYLRTVIYQISDAEYMESIRPMQKNFKQTVSAADTFSEGRSGAFFFYSSDGKYLIKTVKESEAQFLLSILPRFVKFLERETKHGYKSLIVGILGLHSVRMYGATIYFIVCRNMFPMEMNEKYDLKGSWVDRSTHYYAQSGKLMKDSDLHQTMKLPKRESERLYNQLERDTVFLNSCNIMDYSLLLGIKYVKLDHVGFVESKRESIDEYEDNMIEADVIEGPGMYYIGIIDMLQEWNTRKKLERFAKVYLACKDKNGVSCVPPTAYQIRFMRKMAQIGMKYD